MKSLASEHQIDLAGWIRGVVDQVPELQLPGLDAFKGLFDELLGYLSDAVKDTVESFKRLIVDGEWFGALKETWQAQLWPWPDVLKDLSQIPIVIGKVIWELWNTARGGGGGFLNVVSHIADLIGKAAEGVRQVLGLALSAWSRLSLWIWIVLIVVGTIFPGVGNAIGGGIAEVIGLATVGLTMGLDVFDLAKGVKQLVDYAIAWLQSGKSPNAQEEEATAEEPASPEVEEPVSVDEMEADATAGAGTDLIGSLRDLVDELDDVAPGSWVGEVLRMALGVLTKGDKVPDGLVGALPAVMTMAGEMADTAEDVDEDDLIDAIQGQAAIPTEDKAVVNKPAQEEGMPAPAVAVAPEMEALPAGMGADQAPPAANPVLAINPEEVVKGIVDKVVSLTITGLAALLGGFGAALAKKVAGKLKGVVKPKAGGLKGLSKVKGKGGKGGAGRRGAGKKATGRKAESKAARKRRLRSDKKRLRNAKQRNKRNEMKKKKRMMEMQEGQGCAIGQMKGGKKGGQGASRKRRRGHCFGAEMGIEQGLGGQSVLAGSDRGRWIGRRVATLRAGELGYAESLAIEDTKIDPANTRVVWLLQEDEDGYQVQAGLLRSLDWMEEQGIKDVGDRTELDLAEMGAEGEFQVMSIEPCPEIEAGPGRIVTGCFRHSRGLLYQLWVSGETKPIRVTLEHPFWSLDRNDWIAAGELMIGERLAVNGGTAVVLRLEQEKEEPVYNLEVDADHCYRIGEQGILVHNASDPATPKARSVLRKTKRLKGKVGFCILQTLVVSSLEADTWRAGISFTNPTKGVIYILRKKNSNKTILKVGQTSGASATGRWADYVRAYRECDEFEIVAWSIDEANDRQKLLIPEEAIRAAFCKTCPWDNTGGRLGRLGPGVPWEHDSRGSWQPDCKTWTPGAIQRQQQKPRTPAEWKAFRDVWRATKKALEKKMGSVNDTSVDQAVAKALGVGRTSVAGWRRDPVSGLP